MYSGLVIADYFVRECLKKRIPITNMSVLKMIYFAHGFYYALKGKKLVDDPFYAWPWGPVEKKTYDCFKKYVSSPIIATSETTDKELAKLDADKDLTSFLNQFLPLANIDPFLLSQKSHEAGGPWAVTPAYQEIDDRIIQVYFSAKYGKGRK